jgi:hypothetical protein
MLVFEALFYSQVFKPLSARELGRSLVSVLTATFSSGFAPLTVYRVAITGFGPEPCPVHARLLFSIQVFVGLCFLSFAQRAQGERIVCYPWEFRIYRRILVGFFFELFGRAIDICIDLRAL